MQGLYKKYRELFFPDVTVRRSALAPSGLGGGESFKTRQASVACERLFRLDRVFSGLLLSDLVQAQNAAND